MAMAGFLLIAPGAAMADESQAVATAAQHAGLAANAGDLNGVRMHLHHTLNCLVGADGDGFDESAGNPCARAGAAIPQTSDADMMHKLEMIADDVRKGIASSDLGEAKKMAMHAQEMLKE